MMPRNLAATVFCAGLAAAGVGIGVGVGPGGGIGIGPAAAQTNNILDVFQNFEDICFNYAEEGYSVEVRYLLEQAGFMFERRANDGDDYFRSPNVDLQVGNNGCAFGMHNLPFSMMLEWTKAWVDQQGLTFAQTTTRPNGNEYWIWRGDHFRVVLSDEKTKEGMILTALILTPDRISNRPENRVR